MNKNLTLVLALFLMGTVSSNAQRPPEGGDGGDPAYVVACYDSDVSCKMQSSGPTYHDCRSHLNGCCDVYYYTVNCAGGGTQTYARAINHEGLACDSTPVPGSTILGRCK